MEIYVVDTETTNVNNFNNTEDIVEIAICKVDTEERKITAVYEAIPGYDISRWSPAKKNAWIFRNSTLNLKDVDVENGARPVEEVASDVRKILEGEYATSYNYAFDFGKFLREEPWYINNDHLRPGTTAHRLRKNGYMKKHQILDYKSAPCLMETAKYACKIRNYYGYKWPSLDEAIYELDVENMHYKIDKDLVELLTDPDQRHRAMYDAAQASMVLLGLIDRGEYDLPELKIHE